MALKAVKSGFRNIALNTESSYGTSDTTSMYYVPYEGGGWFQRVPNQVYDDSNEITGYIEPTSAGVINWRGEGSHVRRARVNEIGLFATIALGDVNTETVADDGGSVTVYGHRVNPSSAAALKSRTIQEFDGYKYLIVRGVVCTQLQITGGYSATNDGFCQLNATLLANGNISEGSFSKSTSTFGDSLLTYKSVTVTATTTDVTSSDYYKSDLPGSPLTWQSRMREFSWTYNNNGALIYPAGGSYFATRAERRNIEQSLELLLEVDEDVSTDDVWSWFGATAQTEFALQIRMDGATAATIDSTDYTYSVWLTFPRLILTEGGLEKEDADGFLAYRIRPKVLHDTSSNVDTSVAVWIQTTLPSFGSFD